MRIRRKVIIYLINKADIKQRVINLTKNGKYHFYSRVHVLANVLATVIEIALVSFPYFWKHAKLEKYFFQAASTYVERPISEKSKRKKKQRYYALKSVRCVVTKFFLRHA